MIRNDTDEGGEEIRMKRKNRVNDKLGGDAIRDQPRREPLLAPTATHNPALAPRKRKLGKVDRNGMNH